MARAPDPILRRVCGGRYVVEGEGVELMRARRFRYDVEAWRIYDPEIPTRAHLTGPEFEHKLLRDAVAALPTWLSSRR